MSAATYFKMVDGIEMVFDPVANLTMLRADYEELAAAREATRKTNPENSEAKKYILPPPTRTYRGSGQQNFLHRAPAPALAPAAGGVIGEGQEPQKLWVDGRADAPRPRR